jgi:hypothetical protein
MASQPQPTIPRRPDYTFAWILLGVLVVAAVMVFAGVYIFSRYLASQITMDVRHLGRGVEIETPAGSLKVQKSEVSEADLALPVYPGCQRIKGEGATVSIEVPSEKSLQVVAAEFETGDALERVAAFYRKRLGKAFQERRGRQRAEFVMHDAGRQKRVILWRRGEKTRIALANITEAGTN